MAQIKKIIRKLKSNYQKAKLRYLRPGWIPVRFDTLTIEITNRCSLACACCPNGADKGHCRKHETLSTERFKMLLSNIDIDFKTIFLHMHGEPFLNNNLPDIINLLKERDVEEFCIFSNGYNIDIDLLDRTLEQLEGSKLNLGFSAELYSKEMYEKTRCGNYDTAWQSMEKIDAVMFKHNFTYSINAIIGEENIDCLRDTVPPIFSKLKQLKDIHLFNAFPWPHLPETGDIAGHLCSKRKICTQIWDAPVIMASGEVSMCSSDYRGECIVGSLWDEKYSTIVNNKKARNFRRNIALRKPERNSICDNCLIDRMKNFSRIVRRSFIEKNSPQSIELYFNSFHKYFSVTN